MLSSSEVDNRPAKILGLLPHRGESISSMQAEGQADRFVRYYLSRYCSAFEKVYFFSYADEQPSLLDRCIVFPKRLRLRNVAYGAVMPLVWRAHFRECAVLRVFQAVGALPAVLAKIFFSVPFVVTYGYRYTEFARLSNSVGEFYYALLLEKLAVRAADAVIVTTPELQRYVSSRVGASKVHLIPNGVDTEVFRPAERKVPNSVPVVLSVGRFVRRKNFTALVEAMSQLRHNARLVLIGDGPERDSLLKKAQQLGVELELPGVLPHHELVRYLQRADVFVHPSIAEGHPKALIEAMSCGLPCVATHAMGVSSLLEHGRTGLLSGPSSSELASAIEYLVSAPSFAASLGNNARQRICEDYNITHLVATEIGLLKEVAHMRNG